METKFIGIILLLATIFANPKVLTKALECYECEGDNCSNAKSIVCSPDNEATPKPELPTTSTEGTTLTSSASSSTSNQESSSTIPAETTVTSSSTAVGTTESINSINVRTEAHAGANEILKSLISRHRRDAENTYACYTAYYDYKNKSVPKKGCVKDVDQACDIVYDGAKGPLEYCTLCRDNNCNSSSAIKISLASSILMISLWFLNNVMQC